MQVTSATETRCAHALQRSRCRFLPCSLWSAHSFQSEHILLLCSVKEVTAASTASTPHAQSRLLGNSIRRKCFLCFHKKKIYKAYSCVRKNYTSDDSLLVHSNHMTTSNSLSLSRGFSTNITVLQLKRKLYFTASIRTDSARWRIDSISQIPTREIT